MDSQFETGSQTSEHLSHSTGAYFCSNCHYSISNEADYKKHYKSEFHRYNIKRRLVNLPPATFEQFLKRKNKAMESRVKSKESLIENYKCKQCNKSFGSKNTYEQHIKSKKHSKSEKVPEDTKETNEPKDTEEEIPKEKAVKKEVKTTLQDINVCLFCNKQLENLQNNLNHMRIQHSFFITDQTYCKKVEGLIGYLAEKINIGLLCLYCENQGIRDFKSADAVRSHMVDKGHCFMNTDHFDEYTKFYDFSEQLKEYALIAEKVKSKEKLAGEEYIEIVDEEGEGDAEWEEVDEEDDEWEEEEGENKGEKTTDIEGDKEKKKDQDFFKAEREKKKITKYVYLRVKKAKLLDTGEIELPSGKILGNRIYRHIYKQYYRNRASVVDRFKMILGHSLNVNQIALYRRNDQLILSSRVKDFKTRRQINRIEDAHTKRMKAAHLDIGVKANKLQPHFKQQCPL